MLEFDQTVKYADIMAGPTLSSRRSQRTRAALIAAGLDLLVDRPVDAVPIDDVVACAGVAKGSFFNHFADKYDFASAVAAEVRMEVEEQVARANAGITDPVARIAGGMKVAATFAKEHPRRTMVLLRSQTPETNQDHPLNRGLKDDIDAAVRSGLLRQEAGTSGVLYWLGLCQALMASFVELELSQEEAALRTADMLKLGLIGLGVPVERAEELARSVGAASGNIPG